MTYVVTESCIKCKYTDCVEVCPVDAIVSEDDLPEEQKHFLELNKELSQQWPVLAQAKDAPEDADEWADVKEKLEYLER